MVLAWFSPRTKSIARSSVIYVQCFDHIEQIVMRFHLGDKSMIPVHGVSATFYVLKKLGWRVDSFSEFV